MTLLQFLPLQAFAICSLILSNAVLVSSDQNVLQPGHNFHPGLDPNLLSPPALTYIPSIGLGLWNAKGDDATNATTWAFQAGYRHLDSAEAYGNEDYVGKGIAASGLPRSVYWVTSKLWNQDHSPSDVRPALEKTLSQLDIPYLDLYLMHWPVAQKSNGKLDDAISILDTWRAMEDLVRAGLTKTIGVSNFARHDVEDLLLKCEICPAAHEFETHPYLQQTEFVKWHRSKGIQVIAYSPFANLNPGYESDLKPILEDPFWLKMADEKGATPAQTVLAWGIQRGTIVIPKSVHEQRIYENLKSEYVRFSEAELEEIALQDKQIRYNNPGKSWGVPLFDDLDR